ncbi:RHS domain-containing protein [Streptomyces sp. NA04227]|uniref:putative T7SS-secreted protein n=1 Tax=Streptomyces sp. NA04227 TaxID=2742136 RepID=UPI001590D79B|nr:DUF6531 domain-containing protein [Streptomyces sp. NA04227]QKW08518.1 RHS domain-containing protein [Streptomyces sp. NA04227]
MGWDLPGGLDDKAKDLANDGASKLKDGFDKGKEIAGDGVIKAGHGLGSGLESVGADGLADKVEDGADRLGSDLGAEVDEQQLGQTEQAGELIHGNPGKLRDVAGHLKDFAAAFGAVGTGMQAVDSEGWQGVSGEAFRKKFGAHPTKWLRAADACEKAKGALEAYADVVQWAKSQAQIAIDGYREAEKASEAYEKEVIAYALAEMKGNEDQLTKPSTTDPGEEAKEAARALLAEARRQRNAAGTDAVTLVREALQHAPQEPSPLGQMKAAFNDTGTVFKVEAAHAGAGLFKAGAGALNTVRGLNPLDPYNLTHPAAYYENLNMTLAGVGSQVLHPERTALQAYQALKADPSETGGRLIPELFLGRGRGLGKFPTRVNGGADAPSPAEGGPGRKDGPDGAPATQMDADSLNAAQEALKDTMEGKGGPDADKSPGADSNADPDAKGSDESRDRVEQGKGNSEPENRQESGGSDPVNMVTGKMYLPQTDVTIPGALPLVFTRRVESGYRLGRWFGPSWTSTLDQRLQLDAQGVLFVRDDGAVLSYPHPAPGVPVLPEHGPRWPLDRTDDGYTITDPGTLRVWHFADRNDHLAVLEQIDDRNGNWITFEYDAEGTPTGLVHSAGHRLKVSTEDGRVTALALAGAADDGSDLTLMRYGYDGGGQGQGGAGEVSAARNLTEVVNSSGLPLRFTYDEANRVTSWTDTNDRSYFYAYDDRDRCIAEGGEAGHMTLRIEYTDPDPQTGLRETRTVTPEGHTRRFVIDRDDQIVAEIDPLGATVRYERDRLGNILARTDPLGHTTHFTYDADGRVTEVIRPDGRRSTAEYDQLGLPVRVSRFDGTTVRHAYDERGNRTSTTSPSGHTTHYTYDEAGRPTTVTDPAGGVSHIRCDRAGLPVAVTDPLGATTYCARDGLGRAVAVTDPTGSTTRLEWTVEGKLARRVTPDGTAESWTYDGEGNCLTHTDPLGGTTSFEYTHFDLLTARTGPDGVRYEFSHDTELRLTQVSNPQGLTWNYEYDGAGHLVAETDFDDRVQRYEHDAVGRLTGRVTPLGDRITFERNVLGQIVRKDAAGQVTTYAYDFTDQLAEATNPDTQLTILRDRFGRVRSETVAGRELKYTYDEFGRRNGRVTPSGAESSWTYDAAGRREELTTSGRRISYTRDAAGRELSRSVGDLLSIDSTYDPMGRLSSQSVAGEGGTRIQHRAYRYRADGNLTAIEDMLGGTRSFDLDPTGRVTAVHAHGWTETYAYDAAGNQTQANWPDSHPGGEARGERAYEGTRIMRAGNVRYEHDAAGRVVLRQKVRLSRKPDTWRYKWDAEDRLREVVTPDGAVWRYEYDALARRISKSRLGDDGQTVTERVDFTWDGTTLCEQVSTAASMPRPVTLTWDHDGLHPLAQTERITAAEAPQEEIDARFFAIVTDLVGTPTELVAESGEVAWRTRTTLWGSTTWTRDSTAYTPLRFPGQYFDPETGLQYNVFRHYDPGTARYITADPFGLIPSPNALAYVVNPLSWSDPLGLAPNYENQMPEELDRELADAERLGVKPLRVGDNGFDEVINSGTIKWAVSTNGELLVIPKFADGVELKHPVLTNGAPVQAAGEADIAGGNGSYWGMEINNNSGHYRPSQESLRIGREAFERAGVVGFE